MLVVRTAGVLAWAAVIAALGGCGGGPGPVAVPTAAAEPAGFTLTFVGDGGGVPAELSGAAATGVARIEAYFAAIRAGAAPATLAEAWKGTYRYGVAGSLVAYVETISGRALIVELLLARTPTELLTRIGLDEPTLLARWQAWELGRAGATA